MSFFEDLENRFNNVVMSMAPRETAITKALGQEPKTDLGFFVSTLAGETAGAVGDAFGAALSNTVGRAIPDSVKKFAEDQITGAVQSEVGQEVLQWTSENPVEWQKMKNVINLFSLGTGGSLVRQGMLEQKGNWQSTPSNYIDNFYGDDAKNIPPTRLEEMMGEEALKLLNKPTNKTDVARAGKKITGMTNWVMQAPMGALDAMFNPFSRALYAETGISRSSQRKVKEILDNPDATRRDLDKAMGQAIFNRNINVQSGRDAGPISQSLIDIEDFATVQGYKPLNEKNFTSGVLKTKTTLDGKAQYVNPKDAKKAYQYIKDAWNINRPTQVIFKEPIGGTTGNHLNDLAQKNPANTAIRKVLTGFTQRPPTTKLYEKLLEESKADGKFKVLNKSAQDAKQNGLWIQTSFTGSSIVEGGVNAIYKVLPNGRVQGYVSDVHNFLEKLPVLGPAIERSLPTDVLAVSGPIHLDIMGSKWAKNQAKKEGKEFVSRPKPKAIPRETDINPRELLARFAEVNPTNPLKGLKTPAGVALIATGTDEGEQGVN